MALIENEDAARRLARVIISDIELYNREKVSAGRDLKPLVDEGFALFRGRVSDRLHPLFALVVSGSRLAKGLVPGQAEAAALAFPNFSTGGPLAVPPAPAIAPEIHEGRDVSNRPTPVTPLDTAALLEQELVRAQKTEAPPKKETPAPEIVAPAPEVVAPPPAIAGPVASAAPAASPGPDEVHLVDTKPTALAQPPGDEALRIGRGDDLTDKTPVESYAPEVLAAGRATSPAHAVVAEPGDALAMPGIALEVEIPVEPASAVPSVSAAPPAIPAPPPPLPVADEVAAVIPEASAAPEALAALDAVELPARLTSPSLSNSPPPTPVAPLPAIVTPTPSPLAAPTLSPAPLPVPAATLAPPPPAAVAPVAPLNLTPGPGLRPLVPSATPTAVAHDTGAVDSAPNLRPRRSPVTYAVLAFLAAAGAVAYYIWYHRYY